MSLAPSFFSAYTRVVVSVRLRYLLLSHCTLAPSSIVYTFRYTYNTYIHIHIPWCHHGDDDIFFLFFFFFFFFVLFPLHFVENILLYMGTRRITSPYRRRRSVISVRLLLFTVFDVFISRKEPSPAEMFWRLHTKNLRTFRVRHVCVCVCTWCYSFPKLDSRNIDRFIDDKKKKFWNVCRLKACRSDLKIDTETYF